MDWCRDKERVRAWLTHPQRSEHCGYISCCKCRSQMFLQETRCLWTKKRSAKTMQVESPALRALTWKRKEPHFWSRSQDCFHTAAKYSLMPSTETILRVSTEAGPCAITTPPGSFCLAQIHPVDAEHLQVFRSWEAQQGKCLHCKKRFWFELFLTSSFLDGCFHHETGTRGGMWLTCGSVTQGASRGWELCHCRAVGRFVPAVRRLLKWEYKVKKKECKSKGSSKHYVTMIDINCEKN